MTLPLTFMRTVVILVSFFAAMFASGCSKPAQAPGRSPVLTLAASDKGQPQFDYIGPGHLNYRYASDSFTFEIGAAIGTPWTTGKGEMKFTDSNHVIITIQSLSDRPYDIELLGVWTNRTLDIAEDKAKENVHVPTGDQKLRLERFVIWTYDFVKDK